MAKSKSKAKPPKAAAEPNINELSINVINDRLGEAHATLDLILTLTSIPDYETESLCDGTLNTAVHSAMLRIEEAKAAAEKWYAMKAGDLARGSDDAEVSHV